MATLADVAQHQQAITNLVTLAHRDLLKVWRSLDTASATSTAQTLLQVLPELVDLWGTAAGGLGADWFDDLREAAGAPGTYTAQIAPGPPTEQVEALARWGTGPLFSTTPDPDAALSLLSGGMQRLVLDVDRSTIARSAAADPATPTWSRHASRNACTFCRMLATRGAVYHTAESAGEGRKFHDHCHCTAVPSWPGQQTPRAPYVAEWDAAYEAAAREVSGTSAVLAHMRQSLGSA